MSGKFSQVYPSRPSRDGDGVQINRIAGTSMHRILDPFLIIDESNSDTAADYMGGFPEHPHRGFETITYMKALREPIAQFGPFVKNQPEEIEQVIRDFQEGRLVTQCIPGRTHL